MIGNWVFGMIERIWDSEKGKYRAGRKVFIVVDKRNIATLRPIITKYVRPESLLYSDGWGAYRKAGTWKRVASDGNKVPFFQKHKWVNHNKHFVDPTDGTHTNTIEGAWGRSKACVPAKHYCDEVALQQHLFKQMWDAKWKDNLWAGMIEALQMVRFDERSKILVISYCDDVTGKRKMLGWRWKE